MTIVDLDDYDFWCLKVSNGPRGKKYVCTIKHGGSRVSANRYDMYEAMYDAVEKIKERLGLNEQYVYDAATGALSGETAAGRGRVGVMQELTVFEMSRRIASGLMGWQCVKTAGLCEGQYRVVDGIVWRPVGSHPTLETDWHCDAPDAMAEIVEKLIATEIVFELLALLWVPPNERYRCRLTRLGKPGVRELTVRCHAATLPLAVARACCKMLEAK